MHPTHRALILTAIVAWSVAAASPPGVAIEQRYAEARKNPLELYAFLLRMPKGGDLHVHTSGAIYAESYLRVAAEDGLCLDLKNRAIVPPPRYQGATRCGNGVEAAAAQEDSSIASAIIDGLSMRNFVAGAESGHDHFFATFGKFGPYQSKHRGELLAEVVKRAAEQNESYLELMSINGASANTLGSAARFSGDFSADREKLMAAGLAKVVDGMRTKLAAYKAQRDKLS